MQPSGYRLIDIESNEVVQTWGGTYGTLYDPPNPLELPNGDIVCGAEPGGEYSGYRLELWMMDAPSSPIPASVTPRQVRLLLLGQGLLDEVEAMISQQDRATQITWEFATEFRRDDPLLNALGQSLGLTEQQIDDFFVAASTL